MQYYVLCLMVCALIWPASTACGNDLPRIDIQRTPNGGIQPQAAVDQNGSLHLIYYQGQPAGGDVFYVRQQPGQPELSKPVRVNHRPGSAIAIGTIRGAQMALGRNGRVHVVWNGGSQAEPVIIRGEKRTPLLYTRLDPAGNHFEPERNLITWAPGLDGGSSVAADGQGNVYVFWHALPADSPKGEAHRAVFVARSRDDGRTFAREQVANPLPTGACGCCGLRAFADRRGALYLLYRAATEQADRDMMLMVSANQAQDFSLITLNRWKIQSCPMSSSTVAEGSGSVLAAWEADGQVQFAAYNLAAPETLRPISPPGQGQRKHPSIAAGPTQILLAWTENTGWEKGGSLAWQLYTSKGEPLAAKGRADGVPVWSLPSAVWRPEGHFVIFY